MSNVKTKDYKIDELTQIQPITEKFFDLVAIGTSAGGLKALSQILGELPADFPVPIVVVQHLYPQYPSLIANILSDRTSLQVKQAEEGDQLNAGIVYIAPPNYHLLVNLDNTLSLNQSELVNFVRPSADILFNSVAASHKKRAIAVVLTGKGIDGMKGIQAINQAGGTIIAQNQETSEYFGMPNAAIKTGKVNLILPLSLIASALISLITKGNFD